MANSSQTEKPQMTSELLRVRHESSMNEADKTNTDNVSGQKRPFRPNIKFSYQDRSIKDINYFAMIDDIGKTCTES